MVPVLLALALLLQTPAAPPRDVSGQSEPPAGKGVLRGRVLDGLSGQPIKGATVTVYSQRQQEPLSTSTDAEGRWEIAGLPPGEYHPTASKAGYVDGGVNLGRSMGLTESSPERTVDLKIVRGAVLSGRITDANGEPLAGVQVMALREMPTGPGRLGWGGASGGSSTDDRGQFRVFGLAAGEYVLVAQRQDRPQTQAGSKGNRLADVTTYYPGTATLAEAQRFSVGDAAEYSDLTFALQAMASISVSGRVVVSADRIRQSRASSCPRTAQQRSRAAWSWNPPARGGQRLMSIGAMAIDDRMNFWGQEDAIVKPDGTFELKVFHSPVKLYQSGRLQGWVQSGVRWKGHDVRGGLNFDLGQPVDGVELVLRRATSRITGSVSGVQREGEDDNEGTVIVFHQGDENQRGIGMAGSVPIRDGRFAFGPMAAGDYQVVAVRTFDPTMFGKPDVAELLRTRATDVTVGDNETKSVNLTLIADH